MFPLKISAIILAFFGFLDPIQAAINVRITTYEPRSGYVFDTSLITLTCEASTTTNGPLSISWHEENSDATALLNSSSTTIIARIKGNTTIGLLKTSSLRPKVGSFLYVYCKATDTVGNDGDTHHVFSYVKDTPRLQVKLPQTHTLPDGENRIRLICQVSGNTDMKKTKLRWLHGNETLQETQTDLEANKIINSSIFLQCLTQKHLGKYTCVVFATKYSMDLTKSAVTTLKGKFPANTANNQRLNLIVQCLTLLLILRQMCA